MKTSNNDNFDLISIISADPLKDADKFISDWLNQGFHADMHYLKKNHHKRVNPQKIMPRSKSVIIVAKNYYSEESNAYSPQESGSISKYARFRDYHKQIEKMLKSLTHALQQEFPNATTKSYVDHGPILEKGFAQKAGLGFIGKNTTLITPKFGSWVFLGSIITDIPPEKLQSSNQNLSPQSKTPPPKSANPNPPAPCGDCQKCLIACPTKALVAPYTLDARKCISYLTIENRGPIPPALRAKIGNNLFGCDICQQVCPFNQAATYSKPKLCDWPQVIPSNINPIEILELKTNEDFIAKFAGTPIIRAKFTGMIRNACIVSGNLKLKKALPHLKHWQKSQDAMISEHATWAIQQLPTPSPSSKY